MWLDDSIDGYGIQLQCLHGSLPSIRFRPTEYSCDCTVMLGSEVGFDSLGEFDVLVGDLW
jgi:hypothetical protein